MGSQVFSLVAETPNKVGKMALRYTRLFLVVDEAVNHLKLGYRWRRRLSIRIYYILWDLSQQHMMAVRTK